MAQYKDGTYIVKDGKIYEVQIDIPRMMGAEVIHIALKDFKKQTNLVRIRQMSDEELADFIMDVQGDVANYYCGNFMSEPSMPTRKEAWLEWLREDASEVHKT